MEITIIDGTCWKCNQPMKIAFADGKDGMSTYCGPDEFSDEELAVARQNGVVIRKHDSRTAGMAYLANTCVHCNNFAGDLYLFTDYIQPALTGELNYKVYKV